MVSTPEALMTDADLRKVTATLKKMAKDKKLIEAMQAPVTWVQKSLQMAAEQPSAPDFLMKMSKTLPLIWHNVVSTLF